MYASRYVGLWWCLLLEEIIYIYIYICIYVCCVVRNSNVCVFFSGKNPFALLRGTNCYWSMNGSQLEEYPVDVGKHLFDILLGRASIPFVFSFCSFLLGATYVCIRSRAKPGWYSFVWADEGKSTMPISWLTFCGWYPVDQNPNSAK